MFSLQDRIAVIQPDSGEVSGWIDLAGLKSRMPPLPEKPLRPALNGIAYDAEQERLFVTGKLWPKSFKCGCGRGELRFSIRTTTLRSAGYARCAS